MAVNFRRTFLILLVAVISLAFLWMISTFLVTILLAALFSSVAYGLHRQIVRGLGGHEKASAVLTLLLLIVVVVTPLFFVGAAVANEALRINETIGPRIDRLRQPGELDRWLQHAPGYTYVEPYRVQIITRAGELVGNVGGLVFNALSATTKATVLFLFHFVVMLYTMYFFLTDGPRLVRNVLAYLPLAEADKESMLEKFVSVTRATLKGTVLIGLAQGVLGGIAFWVVGIEGAIFWGTVMTVLSIIPGVGGALVWAPAAIILASTGSFWQGLGLALFCSLIIGSVDNVLRPILVGRDTQMHALMIFFSTLGGLLAFGAMGFILGPILAALFLTVWEMFGVAFRTELREAPPVVVTDREAPGPERTS
jgi:predicted PurR-regulated permease PerM